MNKKRLLIISAVVLALCLCFALYVCGNRSEAPVISPSTSSVDYSLSENWAIYENDSSKKADVFLICPTVDLGENGNTNMSLSDEITKGNFVGALNMERGIYDENANIVAPFYEQITLAAYYLPDNKDCINTAYQDVKAAFIHYIENTDAGRPVIIAGFSQGSEMALYLLKDAFKDKILQKRLVAAYLIGWRITDEDLKECPWLKMAEGEGDTGVIVSFNSEAEGVTDSLLVPKGTKTYGINPLNWKTDASVAEAEENLGACFTDYSGNIVSEIPNLCGGYLSAERGTLIVTDITPKQYPGILFDDGIYHLYDYQFFYRNLQNNVNLRINSWIK